MHISADVFWQTKITHKSSDAAENLQLYRVVRFFHLRSSFTTHILADIQRITLNASSCIMISGGRTKQLDIIAGILPHHWLYEWFSQFHSCGTYPVHSRSHSILYEFCHRCMNNEKTLREMQTLCAGCSKVEKKCLPHCRPPSPGRWMAKI